MFSILFAFFKQVNYQVGVNCIQSSPAVFSPFTIGGRFTITIRAHCSIHSCYIVTDNKITNNYQNQVIILYINKKIDKFSLTK